MNMKAEDANQAGTLLLYISRDNTLTEHLSALAPGRVYETCPYEDFQREYHEIRCVFCDAEAFYGDWVNWERIKAVWQDIPIVVIRDSVKTDCAKKALADGAWDCVSRPQNEADLQLILTKLAYYQNYVLNQHELLTSLIASEQESTQKTTVMETMLDILSHDTRNVFLKLRSLIVQLARSELRSQILDTYQELYNGTQEALGYLRESKRVYSLPELVNSLRLSEERIPCKNHPRLVIETDSRYLLFVEVSALFKNVLVNIIENALKYSPQEEKVTVSIRKHRGYHEIGIADRGAGIPDTFKEKIFDRYFRIHEKDGKGSGRGLWISKNIIEKEGGTVCVDDNPGGGTLFRITVPMFRTEAGLDEALKEFSKWFQQPVSEIAKKADTLQVLLELEGFDIPEEERESIIVANVLDALRKQKSGHSTKDIRLKLESLMQLNPDGPRVIIADDSLHVHHYLGHYLTDLGYHVLKFAKNGSEALEYIKTLDADLITLDCTMPEKSGIEVAKETARNGYASKILFITALGDHPDFLGHLERELSGISFGVITKPFTLPQLVKALKVLGLPCGE